MRWLRRFLLTAAAVAGVYLYFAALHPHEKVPEHPFFARPGPWVIAHRGGRGLWPENTLYALERALELGVDVLEMDLRATSDGVIVVLHDDTLDRTTNGTGRVAGATFAAIRRLDAGYRFDDGSGAYPFRGRGLTVPALADVLSRLPGALLNLEMKEFSPALAVELCRLVRMGASARRVLVASFGHDAMAAFRRACPSVATSATAREAVALHALHRAGLASLFRSPAVALQTPEDAGGRTIAESSFLDLARRRNVRMHVWTINDETHMKRLLDLGVHGIMTDYPDRLLRVMGRGRPPAE